MQPWKRPEEPPELRAWRLANTREFVKVKRATGKTPGNSWPEMRNPDGGEETLQEWLSRHTGGRCTYCDCFLNRPARKTIDHFLPKSKFPCLVYAWRNLYLCCDACQKKGTDYDKLVLRPDEYGYKFNDYFRSHRDGRITVIAEGEDALRAEATLRVLRLNDPELVAARAAAYRVPLPPIPRLRPGLDAATALLRARRFEVSFEDRPYRFHYAQEPENE